MCRIRSTAESRFCQLGVWVRDHGVAGAFVQWLVGKVDMFVRKHPKFTELGEGTEQQAQRPEVEDQGLRGQRQHAAPPR